MEKARPLADARATIRSSPKAAVEGAEIVMSMVTDDAAARSVWLEAEIGALHGLKAGTIALECSTVTPAWIRKLGRAVEAARATLLDAPVAGSRPQAEAGELVFMIGGDAEAAERVLPVLAPLAANRLHVGALGQGAVLKLAVNALFAAQLESVAELLGFLVKNSFEANEAASLLANFPIVAPPIGGAAKMMAAKNTVPIFYDRPDREGFELHSRYRQGYGRRSAGCNKRPRRVPAGAGQGPRPGECQRAFRGVRVIDPFAEGEREPPAHGFKTSARADP